MIYTNNYQSNIQKGQEISLNDLRVLAPRTNYDELNIVLNLKLGKKINKGVGYQQNINQ